MTPGLLCSVDEDGEPIGDRRQDGFCGTDARQYLNRTNA